MHCPLVHFMLLHSCMQMLNLQALLVDFYSVFLDVDNVVVSVVSLSEN